MVNLAIVYRHLGRIGEATNTLTKALHCSRRHEAHDTEIKVYINLGYLSRDAQKLDEALEVKRLNFSAFRMRANTTVSPIYAH
jgi:hypothetical protein